MHKISLFQMYIKCLYCLYKKKPWAYLVYILIVCTFIFVNNLERIIVLKFFCGNFCSTKDLIVILIPWCI